MLLNVDSELLAVLFFRCLLYKNLLYGFNIVWDTENSFYWHFPRKIQFVFLTDSHTAINLPQPYVIFFGTCWKLFAELHPAGDNIYIAQ